MSGPRLAALAVTALALAGCSAATDGGDLLATHDLAGMEATEIIEHLDQLSVAERPAELLASVQPDELVLSDGSEQVSLALPDDEFYLSVAPFATQTHECFHHSLTTCLGELSQEELQVTVTSDAGDILIDEQLTTYDNGFIGLWLPRDLEGTLQISGEAGSGQVAVSTGLDDPTCLTTVQLA